MPNKPFVEYLKELEGPTESVYTAMVGDAPELNPGTIRKIQGIDGNEIDVGVYLPTHQKDTGLLPALVYYHGGGMAIFSMKYIDAIYRYLADKGIVVVSVEFRSCLDHPFPAGLHDCYSGVLWISEHAKEYNVDPELIVVGGESGGGNLAAAVSLLDRQKGKNLIKGQYLNCPLLCPDDRSYSSRSNYRGFFLPNTDLLDKLAEYYTPKNEFSTNFLAWPINANDEQLKSLPPTLVVTNEFDSLFDEGNHYASRLQQAGVPVTSVGLLGTVHATSILRTITPDVSNSVMNMVYGWIQSIRKK